MTGSRIVVTGAAGLVGSSVVARLLTDGCGEVYATVRSEKSKAKLLDAIRLRGINDYKERIKFIDVDLEDYADTAKALKGATVIYNCAGMVSFDSSNGERIINANNEIAANIVDAVLENGTGLLIHISSIAALGRTHDSSAITEHTNIESLKGQSAYAKAKLLAENQVWRGVALGLKAIVAAPSVILGAGDWSGSSSIFPAVKKGIPVYTDGTTGYVDVEDVARAMTMLANTPKAVGESFILSAADLSYRELLTKIATALGRKPPRMKAGAAILRAASFLDKITSSLTGKERKITPSLIKTICSKNRYNGSKITRQTNFSYTDIDETIKRIASEYESSH